MPDTPDRSDQPPRSEWRHMALKDRLRYAAPAELLDRPEKGHHEQCCDHRPDTFGGVAQAQARGHPSTATPTERLSIPRALRNRRPERRPISLALRSPRKRTDAFRGFRQRSGPLIRVPERNAYQPPCHREPQRKEGKTDDDGISPARRRLEPVASVTSMPQAVVI